MQKANRMQGNMVKIRTIITSIKDKLCMRVDFASMPASWILFPAYIDYLRGETVYIIFPFNYIVRVARWIYYEIASTRLFVDTKVDKLQKENLRMKDLLIDAFQYLTPTTGIHEDIEDLLKEIEEQNDG